MTKAELVSQISRTTGVDKHVVLQIVEAMMFSVKEAVSHQESVYLRGFGSFSAKYRAPKTARNITRNTTMKIDEHYVPVFKPSKVFVGKVKSNVKPS